MYTFLATEFEKLNKKVPNIHYGGCCVFAEKLYNILDNLGMNPQVIITTVTPDNFSEFFSGDYYVYIDIRHALIKVGNVLIDNNGCYKDINNVLHHGLSDFSCLIINIDELKCLNENVKGWNSRFDRTKIKTVYKTLEKVEKELEKNLVN